jgi:glutamate synthase (NADPH/NADH) small chain
VAERMQKFVSVGQKWPEKRTANERAGDFHEIYRGIYRREGDEQASRCAQCGVPFCQTHCPLQNNIPDWLKLTAEGRLEEAYELPPRPTCRKSAAASARRTGCAKATA